MRKSLKTILLAIAIISATQSCSSIYRGIGTFEPCLPKKEDDITIKQKIINYVGKSDSLYILQLRNNPYLKDKQLRLDLKLIGF